MIWIAIVVMAGMYIGLTILEKEEDDWSVFFKGLRILLIATLIVMLILGLLYSGQSEIVSASIGLGFGFLLYWVDVFIAKKMKIKERKEQ
jgi:hypothetical protein